MTAPTPPVLLLAIDTSGAVVTAALHDGTRVLARAHRDEPRRHAELLVPLIEQVLSDAGRGREELTGVVTGVGPGPFTGLRVAVVTARVLGAALGIAVHGVCSLDGLAEVAPTTLPRFLVATDARRREVHWARYERDPAGRPVRVDGPHVALPADVPVHGLPVVGRGAALYPQVLGEPIEPLDVDAAELATVAARALSEPEGTDTEPAGVLLPAEPLYLRRPDAVEPGARKRVLR